jgi:hypothetical protein
VQPQVAADLLSCLEIRLPKSPDRITAQKANDAGASGASVILGRLIGFTVCNVNGGPNSDDRETHTGYGIRPEPRQDAR